MGKRFDNSRIFDNKEIYFTWNNEETFWKGDYEVRQFGEHSDWDYPEDQETEITILHTERIEHWSEELENWVELIPTPELLEIIKWEIEKSL